MRRAIPPRKLFGFYSKDSLQYLANYPAGRAEAARYDRAQRAIVDRLYQIEAIKRVAERFCRQAPQGADRPGDRHRQDPRRDRACDLLIRAGWVKRILFLCDRRELRKQAKNAFKEFLSEPIRIVTSRVRSTASKRIYLATYPAMMKGFQSFDVGFFDLIIADESHRSIYNVYRDLFHYFDCLRSA